MNDKPKKLEFNTSHEVGTTATDEDLQSKRSRPSSRGAGSSKMIESRFDHAEDVVVQWHLGYSERAKQQRIFECPKEEASTYLEAVDEVQNLLRSVVRAKQGAATCNPGESTERDSAGNGETRGGVLPLPAQNS